MPLHSRTPFDRDHDPQFAEDRSHDGHFLFCTEPLDLDLEPSPFETAPTKPRSHWWGLAADCCYIVIAAGAYLMACWIMAMGLPVMLLLLLSGGQMDMTFAFLGSLFGGFNQATPDRQYAFASNATWCLLALATLIAAWRLPRFLEDVAKGLATWRKVL